MHPRNVQADLRRGLSDETDGSVTRWISALKQGDQAAASGLWESYFRRLVGLARARLGDVPRRVADEEDVALSAFDSFCRRAQAGQFRRLEDRDDLWQILALITVRKAIDLRTYEGRQSRGMGRIRSLTELTREGLEMIGGEEPTPELAAQFIEGGAAEVDFADTVGMAVPPQIERMVVRAQHEFPGVRIGIHVHNTRNTGLANAYAAVQAGADVLDASTGGAGGCPFAPKATGNIPMEDLVFMLEAIGIKTGINLEKLIETSRWFEELLQHPLPAMLPKAGPCWNSPPPLASVA